MSRLAERSRRVAAILVFACSCFLAVSIAWFAVVGFWVSLWRYEAVDALIGPRSDRLHPPFEVFRSLSFGAMILAMVTFIVIYAPLVRLVPWLDWTNAFYKPAPGHAFWGRCSREGLSKLLRWERRCALAWARRVRADIRALEEAD